MSQSQKMLKQLEKASGQNQHILALIFDIRGFTNFCKGEDSFNIANFVKRVYISVLSNYFQDATFYKPTGDGLLMVFNCSPGKELELTKSVVEKSVDLVKDFRNLCKDDLLVHFKTPCNCGIGISRGTACCILSEGEIVDYSGKPLNLASRLSDMARPFGVVFDENVGSCIPVVDLEKEFLTENVYVKGLAEEDPIKVYHTQKTIIPSAFKKPINEPEWMTDSSVVTFQELKNWTGEEAEKMLTKIPLDTSQIILRLSFSKGCNERVIYTWNMNETRNIFYLKVGTEHRVSFKKAYLISQLGEKNLQPDTNIKIEVMYPVKA